MGRVIAVTTFADLETLAGQVPISTHDDGRAITAKIVIPRLDKADLVISARVIYAPQEVGWGFKKLRRRAKRAFNKAKSVAKKIAKNKVFQKIAKTAPIWANIIPPPAGTAIAAGSAAALAAIKIAQAARRGSKKARSFIKASKSRVKQKKRVIRSAVRLNTKMKRSQINPKTRRRVLQKFAAKRGNYEVRLPSGKTVTVPASRV